MATSYTTDKKINALDPITGSLAAADEFVVNKSGDTLKTTLAQVEAAMFAAKTSGTTPQTGDVVVVRRGSLIRQLETQNLVPDGAITKEKIAAAAGIEDSKLAKITTAGKVGGGAIVDGTIGGTTAISTSGNIATTGTGTLAVAGSSTFTGLLTANGGISGSLIGTATSVIDSAITTSKLADGAVTTVKLADGAVTEAKIDPNAKIRGATGGGTDRVFYENDQSVNTNYTITTNKNAMSAGPITVASGVTVTVPNGSTWTIV
jgi:hypothetical protein